MAHPGGSSPAIMDPEENIDAVSAVTNAADNKEPPKARRNQMRILAERKRRSQVENYFGELQALLPHVTHKSGKGAIVGQTINYIQSLEKMKTMLEKRKQEQALARQAATAAAASSSATPPQAAQGMAAMLSSDVVPDGCHDVPPLPLQQQPLAAAVPMSSDIPILQPLQQPEPPQLPVTTGPVRFQTWSWPNLVLNVLNDKAYINVFAPHHLCTQTMVMVLSVLNNHGIDVVTVQVDSDAVRSVFNIFARVTGMGGENPSSEEAYMLAISEILLFLDTN